MLALPNTFKKLLSKGTIYFGFHLRAFSSSSWQMPGDRSRTQMAPFHPQSVSKEQKVVLNCSTPKATTRNPLHSWRLPPSDSIGPSLDEMFKFMSLCGDATFKQEQNLSFFLTLFIQFGDNIQKSLSNLRSFTSHLYFNGLALKIYYKRKIKPFWGVLFNFFVVLLAVVGSNVCAINEEFQFLIK